MENQKDRKGSIRNETEVRRKLRHAKYQYLAKEYRKRLSRKPENCKYYYVHREEDPETGEVVEIGLCMFGAENPEEWPGTICDEADECENFEPLYTKEEVKIDFEESLEDDVIVAHNYKDIAALQWVLDEKVYSWDLLWYQRLHLWFVCLFYKLSHFIRRSGLN